MRGVRVKVYTLETDTVDGMSGAEAPAELPFVTGVRHVECIKRSDRFSCVVLDKPGDAEVASETQCWGCGGWLNEPPRSAAESAGLLSWLP